MPHKNVRAGSWDCHTCGVCVCVCARVYVCVSYLEGESVLAGAEPHVLHGGAVDHHLSHISAGHEHWAAGLKETVIRYIEQRWIWFTWERKTSP